ncbi:MAG: hypothetical protein K2O65_13450 [Lachnospiraceae bacterium]|nr:hypothetical protein [Lachnospiraceae bacterium]
MRIVRDSPAAAGWAASSAAPVPAAVLPVDRVQAAAVPMRAVVAVPMRAAAVTAHTWVVAAARRALADPIAAVVHTTAESAAVPERAVTLARALPAVQS